MAKTFSKTGLISSVGAAVLAGVTIFGSVAVADFGSGFREFKQDSCDPLLTGVLTNKGYADADLEDIYGKGYGLDAQRGCGFSKLEPVSTAPLGDLPDQGFDPNQFQPINPANTDPQPFQPQPIVAAPQTPIDLPLPSNPLPAIVAGAAAIGAGAVALDNLPDLDQEVDVSGDGFVSGLYTRLNGAYAWPSEAGAAFYNAPTLSDETFLSEISQAYGGSTALGYAFDFEGLGFFNSMRSELQGSYYQMDMEPVDLPLQGERIDAGQENLYGGFLNLLADINLGLPVTPYVGAGIGYGRRDVHVTATGTGAIPNDTHKFEADGLLYQGMLGAGYALSKKLSLDVGYKYLKSFDIEGAPDQGGTVETWDLKGRKHHIVEGGLTYKF